MRRPEKSLLHSDIKPGIKSARRTLAYLLRATRLRTQRAAIGASRYMRLSGELADALVPLVVSERSMLSFYRALCSRFSVDPTGSDSEYGSIEAWLPDGRIRWDRACAALNYDDVRLVIHESPDFLATFACDNAAEGEDDQFDAFPDPIESGTYRPKLPGALIAPRSYRAVWTLTSPMHHGADEKSGNVNLFRRQLSYDPLTGRRYFVPFMSGNAVRGLLRDMVMGRWLSLLGLRSDQIPTARAHALLAGGAVETGADTATVNNVVRRRARELCPPWDLFAGCTDQQIMSGRARIGDATLVCRENAWKVREAVGSDLDMEQFAATLPSAVEMTTLRLGTRHKHADIEDSDGVQMLFNTELLVAGAQMVHTIQIWGIDGVSFVTQSCLADLLNDFRDVGSVGAGAARGFGSIAFDGYEPGPGAAPLPSPQVYLDYVASRRDEMIEWAMKLNEPKPQEQRGGKGRRKAKGGAPASEAEIAEAGL